VENASGKNGNEDRQKDFPPLLRTSLEKKEKLCPYITTTYDHLGEIVKVIVLMTEKTSKKREGKAGSKRTDQTGKGNVTPQHENGKAEGPGRWRGTPGLTSSGPFKKELVLRWGVQEFRRGKGQGAKRKITREKARGLNLFFSKIEGNADKDKNTVRLQKKGKPRKKGGTIDSLRSNLGVPLKKKKWKQNP